MDHDEPNLMSNEKTKPIQWTERPTGALVVVGSLWPKTKVSELVFSLKFVVKGFSPSLLDLPHLSFHYPLVKILLL